MIAPEISEAEVRALLQNVKAGDPSALDQLLARHRGYLRTIVELRMDPKLRARLDPSDVVQEAQLEAARRIGDYLERTPMPFHLWLRRTAFENLLRLRRRHVEADCRSVNNEMPLPDSSSLMLVRKIFSQEPNPGDQVVERELADRLRQALAQLDEADGEILIMRTVEGLTNQEVAQIFDIDASAASKRYGRAILKLRQILFDSGLSESKL